MIHPDADLIRRRCAQIRDEFIAMSARDAALPTYEGLPINEHTQGWVNVCYELGEVAIVRINARDPHLPKFAREAAVFNNPRVRDVATVPRVIVHEPARWQYPVLVTSRLPRDNLEHHWPTLPAPQRHALATHAGVLLAALHAVRSPAGFGDCQATLKSDPFATRKVHPPQDGVVEVIGEVNADCIRPDWRFSLNR